MKAFKLSQYPLLKQIIILFSSVLLLLFFVIVPIINRNLNQITDDQIYDDIITASQNYLKYDFAYSSITIEKQMYHLLYNHQTGATQISATLIKSDLVLLVEIIEKDLNHMLNHNLSEIKGKGDFKKDTMYYYIQRLDQNNYIISFAYSDYNSELVNSLQEQVIYIFYATFGLFLFIILVWLNSILKPLKQITNYIHSIKEDKKINLEINRLDEIGVVADSLVELQIELDHQNKIKEEMMHNISHDLKTPIALIQMYTQSVKDGIYPYGDLGSSLNVILDNTKRLENKVKSLLYLNRLEYLKESIHNDQCNIKYLIEEMMHTRAPIYQNIEQILELDDCIVSGKEEYWYICLENIIDNGYRYANSQIKVITNDNYIEIYNDGLNIPTELLNQLFKPYQKGLNGQFGLGLSIVSKTVELYQYQIKVVNHEVGVSFIIYKS